MAKSEPTPVIEAEPTALDIQAAEQAAVEAAVARKAPAPEPTEDES